MKNKINLNFIKVDLETEQISIDDRNNYGIAQFQLISRVLNNRAVKYKHYTFFKQEEFDVLQKKEKKDASSLLKAKQRLVKQENTSRHTIYDYEN